MNSIKQNNILNSNQNILEKYLEFIFDKEIWINKEVYKVCELTYSYKSEFENNNFELWYHFNTTLFSSIWWLDYETFVNSSKEKRLQLLKIAWEEVKKIIPWKILDIDNTIKKINNLEYKINSWSNLADLQKEINNKKIFNLQKEIFIKSLIYNKKLLTQALIWLPFELDKAWLKHSLSEEEIESKIKQIDEIDNELFWWNIKDSEKEIIKTYERFRTKLEQEWKTQEFQKELKAIESLLPKTYKFKKYLEPKKVIETKLNSKNSNKDFVEILNEYNQSQSINYPVILDNVSNITDDIDSLKIPLNTKDYDLITAIKRIAHEIDAHTINLKNWIKLIWLLRWANNLEKEEWLAMLLEYLFEHGKNAYVKNENWNLEIDIDKIDVWQYFPKYLLSEILPSKDLVEFIDKYNNIEKDSAITPVARLLRIKRNRPLEFKWHQCKDMTYIRWMMQTAEYVNLWNNALNLFLGKVWLSDIDKLVEIKNLKEQNWETLDLIEPRFMYEQIYFKLLQKFNKEKYRKIDFKTYIQNKYKIINFSDLKLTNLIKTTKYKIVKILNILKKDLQLEKNRKKWALKNYIKNENIISRKTIIDKKIDQIILNT